MSNPGQALRPKMVLRNRYLFLLDVLLIPCVVALSFTLRFEEWRLWDFRYSQQALAFAGMALLVKPLVYYAFGLYAQAWRYAGRREAQSVLLAVSAASGVLAVTVLGLFLPQGLGERLGLSHLVEFPRSVLAIDWLISLPLVGGVRAAVRLLPTTGTAGKTWGLASQQDRKRRLLVVGAGEAGSTVVHEILNNPGLGLLPVAFVDDDPKKLNMHINGVQVLGNREDIPYLVQTMGIQEIIVALPAAPGREIRSIVRICEKTSARCRVVPGLFELIGGRLSIGQIREPRIEDVLRREVVDLGPREGPRYLGGASILVTGAGGSIGSELCRQVAAHKPGQLILLGHGENSIYQIHLELSRTFPEVRTVPVIGDIKSRAQIQRVFAQFGPDVVFHAAAHKHVPLMEANVDEVIANNVFGTRNVLETSLDSGVSRFVFISSDKAVNPISLLGVSKRIGELMVQRAAGQDGGAYLSVRFGNVLGSRGSVVPLFLAQIGSGGPVTVTHPETTRYFMTASEAVHLILHAAALGRGGEVFVLDMGEPVRIADLAQDLVMLQGLEPGKDIEIVYTGLRPGEKLHEEILSEEEVRMPTLNPFISVAQGNGRNGSDLERELRELEPLVNAGALDAIKARLSLMVPEYWPDAVMPAGDAQFAGERS